MARTFYKYAEREADSQINWFQVGKDITDMLSKEVETREKKKAALDEASRKFGEELENAPQGNADDVNKWTTDFSGDMQSYRLMTDRLFKSGKLKEKDYALIRQNTVDGTKNLFNLAKEYQAEYDEKQKRRADGISSGSETQFMAMVEGFANLNETKALINPTTGAINVGKMTTGKDGVRVLAEGSNNYMTVNQLRNRIKEKINKYQLNDQLEAESKLMGDVVKEFVSKTGSSTQAGFLTKYTDPTLRKGLAQEGQQAVDAYIGLENKIVQAQLSNPFNISSVLFDWAGGVDPKTGKAYQVTTDETEAASSSHFVLWTYKKGIFQPDFESTENGREQYKNAEEYTKNKLRGMLEQKTEVEPFFQPRKEYAPSFLYERGDKEKEQEDALNLWQQFYSATTTGGKSAAKQGILIDTKDGKSVKLIYADKAKNREIKIIDDETGRTVSGDEWAAFGTELHGITDTRKYSRFSKDIFGNQGIDWEGISGGRAGTQDPSALYGKYVAENIPSFSTTDEETAVKDLAPKLKAIGFSVSSPYDPSGEYIVIKNKDGVKSDKIDIESPNALEQVRGFLLSNIPGAKMEDKAFFLSNLMKTGVFDEQSKSSSNKQDAGIKNRISGY